MAFNLGKPILVMLVVALISSVFVLAQRGPPRADERVWTFADDHAQGYRQILPAYEKMYHDRIDLQVVGYTALNLRLGTMFMSGQRLADSPDIAEVEIGAVGQFFRPPVSQVGFIPLNHYLENSGARIIDSLAAPGHQGWNAQLQGTTQIYTYDGDRWVLNPARSKPDMWIDRLVRTRFAPWSKEGVIFGVPHDVHPVEIAYRKDLFDEAGVDLEAPRTWAEFQAACVKFQDYWRTHGKPERHAMELQLADSNPMVIMLNQRHINLVDDQNRLFLTDPKVLDTLLFYVRMILGPQAVAGESAPGIGAFTNDLRDGNICAYLVPDWRVTNLKMYGGPVMAGKLRLRDLPRFEPDDAPTATWGGTMMGILKTCPDPDRAWRLVQYLYFSPAGLKARQENTDILPPIKDLWNEPFYHQPDPFFGGQKINELFIRQANQIPAKYNSAASGLVQSAFTDVLVQAEGYYRDHGDAGLKEACAGWLQAQQADLALRIQHMQISDSAAPGEARP